VLAEGGDRLGLLHGFDSLQPTLQPSGWFSVGVPDDSRVAIPSSDYE
jgi:hypothetical protein